MNTPHHARLRLSAVLLGLALLIAAAYHTCHALGWREHTSLLSGTPPVAGVSFGTAVWQGGVYGLLYFAYVLLAPILVIAAALATLAAIFLRRKPDTAAGPSDPAGPRA